MPQEAQLSHRVIRNANLAYVSNSSPISTDAQFVPGSKDILCLPQGYAVRRPGFSQNVEQSPTTFTNLQRQVVFEFTGGVFIEFANDITATSSVVYSKTVGIGNYVALYTDTGSTTPFDFTSSNNTVYFSNGHVAKKYNPTNGLSNWGISVATTTIAGPTTCTSGTDDGTQGNAWTNPSNVTSAVNYASITLSGTHAQSDGITCTGFGFSTTGTILGIVATIDATCTGSGGLQVFPVLNGSVISTGLKVVQFTSSPVTFTLGSSSDTWGQTWTPTQINAANFGISVNARNPSAPTTSTYQIRNVRLTIYYAGGPVVTLTGTGLTATVGYQYVVCYGNSNTGHVSSPSPGSNVVKPINQSMQVALLASPDPQVNQIRVFRSTDSVASGQTAGTFFEIPTSPFTNSNQTIVDSSADIDLNVSSIAPTPTFNDPPTPGTSTVYFAGRIWMITGNSVVFSGNEEITAGVPEECFPSGRAGNYWTFNEPPQALAVAGTQLNQQLLIFCGGWVYGISGNTLDTFQRFVVSQRRGCRNVKAISALGGMVAWRDSSGQVWATDGTNLNEIGIDIRPDLTPYTPGNDSVCFHVNGTQHWLLVSTGTQIFAYDMDLGTWMPPWSFACNNLFSGETAPGQYTLLASTTTKALQLGNGTAGQNNDNGATYQPVIRTALMSLVPDFGTRFSFAAVGFYDEPSRTGTPYYFQIDTNATALGDISYLNDDDPQEASDTDYKVISTQVTNPQTAFNRGQGKNLKQNVYSQIEPTSRWISWQIKGQHADDALAIYSYYMAYKQTR